MAENGERENGVSEELLIGRVEGENGGSNLLEHAESELTRRQTRFDSSQSLSGSFRKTPLALATRPSCYSSCSSSSELEAPAVGACEEGEEYVGQMRSSHVYEQEQGVVGLRKVTRSSEDLRLSLCTPRLLSALRPLITSKYGNIQVYPFYL